MARRLKGILAAFAAGVVSLLVSVPASVFIAERRAAPNVLFERSGELSFQMSFIRVNLLPAFGIAVLVFVLSALWMQRRRSAGR
jgi:ethanolamine transporter EutH